MLPSTGLFKSIICPHFDSGGCSRPYCHFKHARKDEETEVPKNTVYTPTPKSTPTLLTLGEPVRKKTKLEYVPTKPALDQVHTKTEYVSSESNIPVYIPSNSVQLDNNETIDNSKKSDALETTTTASYSLHDLIEPTNEQAVDIDNTLDDSTNFEEENNDSTESHGKADELHVNKSPTEQIVPPEDKPKEMKSSSKDKSHHRSSSKSHSSHKSSRHSSSSSRHKHSSSSKGKSDDKSKDKDKDSSSKHKERDKHSHSSKSNSDRNKSNSSRSSSRKDSSHKRDSSKKDDSSKKRHSSSSKSSKSSSHRKRSRSKDKSHSQHKSDSDVEIIPSPPNSILSITSDEEDIMEQCKMIFEEYNTKSAAEVQSAPEPVQVPKTDDDKYDDVNKKKRTAHDITAKPLIQPSVKKPNFNHSAMHSIYRREEVIRKQQEQAAAAAVAKTAAEDLANKEIEASKRTTENNMTPLIPRGYRTPPMNVRPTILQVSNVMALERAKKKIEELKAQRQLTPCQTASKYVSRVAHANPAVAESKPAPPVLEANSTKISYNLRMQYYNMMVTHCLNIYPSCEDAWDRAQTEELTVFKKCNTPIIYKSSALLTINKLKKESIEAGNVLTDKNKTVSHEVILAGKLAQDTSWSVNRKKKSGDSSGSVKNIDRLPGNKAYGYVHGCCLTDEQLQSNGYPRSGPRPGTAIISTHRKLRPPSETERYCGRCSKLFKLTMYDEEAVDECNYHPKSTGYRRGFADNLHRCCQQPAGTLGCTYANYHITDYVDYDNLTGFVTTIDPKEGYVPTTKDIFALDCEMCYTTVGMELTRITVVDFNSKTVYDALVKPDNKIVDYNTTYSGITEVMLRKEKRTLRDVQAILLSMFHSKTILIGHSLESDMKALKLIHSVVVDTSVLYPHKMGPPKKRALRTLCIENLKRIIQENEHGHDSAEDAEVCIQLVKFYLSNRIV